MQLVLAYATHTGEAVANEVPTVKPYEYEPALLFNALATPPDVAQ